MTDRTDRLDELIDQLMTDTGPVPATGDAELDALAEIANDLVGLPRETFRARLAADLEGRSTMTSATSYIPEGLGVVTPYLLIPNPPAAITFYKEVFDAIEIMRHEDSGHVVHAKLNIGGSVVELGEHDDRPESEMTKLPPVGMHLYVSDVDAVLAKATRAGARVLYPIMDQPYGDREVSVADPFGVVWFIATHLHN
jgi:PhnB protein